MCRSHYFFKTRALTLSDVDKKESVGTVAFRNNYDYGCCPDLSICDCELMAAFIRLLMTLFILESKRNLTRILSKIHLANGGRYSRGIESYFDRGHPSLRMS